MKIFLLLLSAFLGAECTPKILVAFPVQDHATEAIFTPLCVALAKEDLHVYTITPQTKPLQRFTNIRQVVVPWRRPRQQRNFFEIADDVKHLSEALAAVKEDISKLERTWKDLNGYQDFDMIIVPLRHRTVIEPFLGSCKSPSCPVVTISVNGFDHLEMGAVSKNWQHPLLFPASGKLFDPTAGVMTRMWDYLTFILHLLFLPNECSGHKGAAPHNVLTLINDHQIITEAVPLLPQQVEVPGLHVNFTNLTKELHGFLDKSTEGIIYFDLGDDVKSHHMPKLTKRAFLDALQQLPQKVVWRYEATDIMAMHVGPRTKWIQRGSQAAAVLDLPDTHAFISSCDTSGIHAATWHGVPVLCLPVTKSQARFAALLQQQGRAVVLQWEHVTGTDVIEAINKLVKQKRYKIKQQAASSALKTYSRDSMKKAIWHIRYALRFPREHELRYLAEELPTLSLFSVDVVLLFVTLVVSEAVVIHLIIASPMNMEIVGTGVLFCIANLFLFTLGCDRVWNEGDRY